MSTTNCQYTIKINLILFHCKEFQYLLLCIKDNKRESGILFNLKVNNLLIKIPSEVAGIIAVLTVYFMNV